MNRYLGYAAAAAGLAISSAAADLTLPLAASETVSRHTVSFQCDQHASSLGMPAGAFKVEYLNWAGNSLAVLPIAGHLTVFAGVMAGSGARYAAGQYVWWDAGSRGVHLYSDSLSGKDQTSCQRVP